MSEASAEYTIQELLSKYKIKATTFEQLRRRGLLDLKEVVKGFKVRYRIMSLETEERLQVARICPDELENGLLPILPFHRWMSYMLLTHSAEETHAAIYDYNLLPREVPNPTGKSPDEMIDTGRSVKRMVEPASLRRVTDWQTNIAKAISSKRLSMVSVIKKGADPNKKQLRVLQRAFEVAGVTALAESPTLVSRMQPILMDEDVKLRVDAVMLLEATPKELSQVLAVTTGLMLPESLSLIYRSTFMDFSFLNTEYRRLRWKARILRSWWTRFERAIGHTAKEFLTLNGLRDDLAVELDAVKQALRRKVNLAAIHGGDASDLSKDIASFVRVAERLNEVQAEMDTSSAKDAIQRFRKPPIQGDLPPLVQLGQVRKLAVEKKAAQ